MPTALKARVLCAVALAMTMGCGESQRAGNVQDWTDRSDMGSGRVPRLLIADARQVRALNRIAVAARVGKPRTHEFDAVIAELTPAARQYRGEAHYCLAAAAQFADDGLVTDDHELADAIGRAIGDAAMVVAVRRDADARQVDIAELIRDFFDGGETHAPTREALTEAVSVVSAALAEAGQDKKIVLLGH